MNKKYLIIYHLEDNDGVCSCAILKYYIVHQLKVNEENIILLPATYAILSKIVENNFSFIDKNGDEYNILDSFTNVIMTDISFNDFKFMKILYDKYKSNFIWIDHHFPIIQESVKAGYDVLIPGVRDIYRSAILNAYKFCYDPLDIEYLYQDKKVPHVLLVLSAIDSWTHEREGLDFEYCRNINAGFRISSKLSVDWYYDRMYDILNTKNDEELNNKYVNEMFAIGKDESEAYDKKWKTAVEHHGQDGFTVNGRSAILLFTSEGTSTLCFKSVKDKYLNGIAIKTSSTGDILISLYNLDNQHDFHCGLYLKEKYNGGGHEGAAGATISKEKFIECFISKKF